MHEFAPDGTIRARATPGGVSVALDALMRDRGGVWIAHGAGSADRAVVDEQNSVEVPPDAPAYRLRRLWLSAEEEEGYYAGFANSALWPLCHQAHVKPVFKQSDWETYQTVNRRFADAVAIEAPPDSSVFLNDYHLALVAALSAPSGARSSGRRSSGIFPGRTSIGCASAHGARTSSKACSTTTSWRFSSRAIRRTFSPPRMRRSARRRLATPFTTAIGWCASCRFRLAPTSIALPAFSRPASFRTRCAGSSPSWGSRGRSSASASIGWTTRRAFRSGSRRSSACSPGGRGLPSDSSSCRSACRRAKRCPATPRSPPKSRTRSPG